MDLGFLKIKIDIKSAHDECQKRYDFKRKEMKKEEIRKVFDGFKDFFKADGSFKFKENEHSIAAEYKEHGVKLEMDVYKNIDSPDFLLEGIIKTYERDVFEFVAEGVCNKEMPLQPAFASEHDRLIHDTRFYQDFLEGDLTYTFRYRIKGREDEYFASMQELMLAL